MSCDKTQFPTGQDGRYIADDIFRCIFVNEKFCILIKMSLDPKGPIDVTHRLKLLDRMCKYEMDPASIVEDTERT